MLLPLVGVVPTLRSCGLSWRQLYESGCFFQRELVEDGRLATDLRKRGSQLTQVGREDWESWDKVGAVRPVAFAKTGYFSGHSVPALEPEYIVFRNEQPGFEPWDNYAWDADGYPHVSALFTPWQLLVAPDAIEASRVSVPLEVLLRDSGRDEWAESLRWFFEEKHRQWSLLHEWWDPMLRVLVRLQNHYWPYIRGTGHVLHDDDGVLYDPEERLSFNAESVLGELELTVEDIADGYRHLARRGRALEFGDSWYLLRQMAPRARRRSFDGGARRAQDFYDAAEVLRRFYRDLTGLVLPDAEVVACSYTGEELEARSRLRERFLGHAPALTYDADDAKRMLSAIGIYPHGVHVIVEGDSEEVVVIGLVARMLGDAFVADVVLTNLRGIGGATRIEKLLSAVTDYALRTVVIVDNEGAVQSVVDQLLADGLLQSEDVLVQSESLEESNFSDDELVSIAIDLAATAHDNRPAARLELTGDQLRAYHDERLGRAGKESPGLADSLLKLAGREEHGAVRFSKPELAGAILDRLFSEVAGKTRDEVAPVAGRRPVLKHLVERVINPLADAPLDRPRRRR